MGNLYCKSHKGHVPRVMLPINRVPRNEQYNWYKTFRDASDDDIIQIAKISPQMITTVMFFDILDQDTKTCNCTYLLEKCISSGEEKSKANLLFLLERSVLLGTCPHILFRQKDGDLDVHELSDEQLLAILQDSEKYQQADPRHSKSSSFGFYFIHLIVIFGRTTLIKKLLPILQGVHIPLFVLQTPPTWCMPFYLAVLSGNEELTNLLTKLSFQISTNMIQTRLSNNSSTIASERRYIVERLSSRGNVKALQTFFSLHENRTNVNFQQALRGAFSSKSESSLDYLTQIGAKPDSKTVSTEFPKAIKKSDVFTLVYLLQFCDVTITEDLLISAIQTGNKSIMRASLQKLEQTSLPYAGWSRCVVETVFRNYRNIMKQLIVFKFDVNACFGGLSVLKWAEILKYEEIQHILIEAGGRSFQEFTNISPYNSVLHLNNDLTVPLLKTMVKNGYDVNDDSDGTPAVFTTMKTERYSLMTLLLVNGANPYLKPDTWKYFLLRQDRNCQQLLLSFVQANLALSFDTKMTLIEHICEGNVDFRTETVRTLLKCAHSLTSKDKDLLLQHSKSSLVGEDLKKDIKDFLFKPMSLQVCCRNSLRRKFGLNFHRLIVKEKNNLPKKIIRFLQCNDVLDEFYSDCEQESNKEYIA